MKVIDPAAQKEDDKRSIAISRALGNLNLPFLDSEVNAQDVASNTLQKVLDNKYFLLRNTTIEELDVPIPLILVGPPGIWAIYTSSAKGIFQAVENSWEEMDYRTQRFKAGKPNLVVRAVLFAKAVENHLSRQNIKSTEVRPVLFFSDPGVHVDASRPVARIILADALERFAASIIQSPAALDAKNVQEVVEAFSSGAEGRGSEGWIGETHDAFSFRDLPSRKKPSPPSFLTNVGRGEPAFVKRISERVRFSRRQLVLLALLLAVNLVILIALVLVVLLLA